MAQKLGQGRSLSHVGVITVMGLLGVVLPVQAQVTPGQDELGTEVRRQGDRFLIQGGTLSENGANLFHSFEAFGLSPGQLANFRTDAEVQTILGRVVGGNPSLIDGLIRVTGSNADLLLMNPAGIVLGANARLDVPASFTATSADRITFGDRFFSSTESSEYQTLLGQPDGFTFRLSEPGAIVNAGRLRVDPGASITLLGGTVVNTGTLIAPGGTITLAAVEGEQYVRLQSEDRLLSFDLAAIPSASGILPLTAPSLPELLTRPGLRHATGVQVNPDGTVVLTGSQISIPTETGTAIASGRLATASVESQRSQINILGDRIGVLDATLNVSGATAGQVRIGGGNQGEDPIPNSQTTVVNDGTLIHANALTPQAEGGEVVIWSDGATSVSGQIGARGGEGGRGGSVEISGGESLRFHGRVTTRTLNGTPGTLLLDPENIVIVAGADSAPDDDQLADQQILAGDAPGSTFTISQAALENALQSTNTILEATNNIRIEPLSGGRLSGSSLGTSLTFIADSDNSGGGTFRMNRNDAIATLGGDITISAASIIAGNFDTTSDFGGSGTVELRAENSIQTSDIETGSIFSNAGDVRIIAGGDIRTGGIDTSFRSSGSGDAAGSVTILSINDPSIDTRTLSSSDSATNPAGNVTVEYIDASSFFGRGGDVILTGDRVLITGTVSEEGTPSIDTSGAISEISRTRRVVDESGQIQITHSGGPNNVPFTVGNVSAFNGTASDIVAGPVTLTGGRVNSVFPVPVIGETIRTFDNANGDERIRITGVNEAPILRRNARSFERDQPARRVSGEVGDVRVPNNSNVVATLNEGQTALQSIEEEAGVKPAILYVDFVPQTSTLPHDFNSLETAVSGDVADHLDRFIDAPLRVTSESSPDDILELLLVTSSGNPIRVAVPGVTRKQVQDAADSMRLEITNPRSRPQDYLPPSQQLYTWLITPILADLQEQEVENLVFVMTAGLRSLPVAALHDGNQFLVETYSLGLMPSLSLTDTRYVDIRNMSVLAMGASEFTNQVPLPAVPFEVQGITAELWRGQTFLNEAFTLDNLRFQRSQTPYGIVHLATHGEFKPGNLANSYIQLWDRQLSLSDIRQLGLDSPATELLVLSACRTALGDETAELGFAGSAVQAGVKSVLASLWYVSDRATLAFMREFYTQLRMAPVKSHALQAAQQAMLRGDWQVEQGQLVDRNGDRLILPPSLVFDGSGNDLSHPFYWAAFTMVGNPW
ncbi:MAG: CHAT domain-containing protein [Synechococcales cyanobacterium K44_A2020_017]|nr:CHAT domain-containing protein [Synechococcales cyanobacterium K32_A2020_035]MBF2095591.1 CHAT domain-containing protein [Synechococcales cyanobacterium K44_A2020_017]